MSGLGFRISAFFQKAAVFRKPLFKVQDCIGGLIGGVIFAGGNAEFGRA